MSYEFHQSVCNEVFEKWAFADTCKAVKKAGYTGIEIAPFTLAEDPVAIPASKRREYVDIMQSEGLKFVGLHWLLVSPKGLHVTTPDKGLRERSWQYVRGLVDLCADLGPNGILVFGSPAQRSIAGGLDRAQAMRHFTEGLAFVAPHAAERKATVLVEALPAPGCDVVNTLDEAAAIVREIGSPGIQMMFDTHNAVNERESHAALVDRYFERIRHVHINEMDGRHPGTGSYDFKPVLRVLARRGYTGWLSLEVFDFSAGAVEIAGDSLRYMESEIAKLNL